MHWSHIPLLALQLVNTPGVTCLAYLPVVVYGQQSGISIQVITSSCLQFVVGQEIVELGEALRSIQRWQEKNNNRRIGEVESTTN